MTKQTPAVAELKVPLAFIEAILHGDEEHRMWLVEAAACWNSGKPVPLPRTPTTPPSSQELADELRRIVFSAMKAHHAAPALLRRDMMDDTLKEAVSAILALRQRTTGPARDDVLRIAEQALNTILQSSIDAGNMQLVAARALSDLAALKTTPTQPGEEQP